MVSQPPHLDSGSNEPHDERAYWHERAAREPPIVAPDGTVLRFTGHSLMQTFRRGLSIQDVHDTIEAARPTQYYHKSERKIGYYDALTSIFVGSAESSGRITTVIRNVSPDYVRGLR